MVSKQGYNGKLTGVVFLSNTENTEIIIISPELVILPNRLCSIWFTTQDKKSRKFNLPDVSKSQILRVIRSC
jgi:hypothetical protein